MATTKDESDVRLLTPLPQRPDPLTAEQIGGKAGGYTFAPLRHCPQSCNWRGACIGLQSGAWECRCLMGYAGERGACGRKG